MRYQKLEQGLKDFQAANKDTFQYTQENWANIQELNSLILQFKDDPQEFIAPNNEYSTVELQLRIAKLKAQISEYVDTIDWEQTKRRDIENQIEQKQKLLKEAQSRNRLTKMFSSLEQTLENEIAELEVKKRGYIDVDFIQKLTTPLTEEQQAELGILTLETASLLDESQLLRRMHDLSAPKGKIKEDYVDGLRKRFKENGPTYQGFGKLIGILPYRLKDLESKVPRNDDETQDEYIKRLREQYTLVENFKALTQKFPIPSDLNRNPQAGDSVDADMQSYLAKVQDYIGVLTQNIDEQNTKEDMKQKLRSEKESLETLLHNRKIALNNPEILEFVQDYDAQMTAMQKIYKKEPGETDSAYIQRATAYLEQERRLQNSVEAYDALPKQDILLRLQATIPRNPEENEKDYIERVEKNIKLNRLGLTETELETQLKSINPRMRNETDVSYNARIEAIKSSDITAINGMVEEYKKLTQNPLLSLESQAILEYLHKIHPLNGMDEPMYRAQLDDLTTALGEYEKAKKAESTASSDEQILALKADTRAKLEAITKIILVNDITQTDGVTRKEFRKEYLQRISNIVDVYEKFKKSESDAPKAETLYSPPDNPLVNVTYHMGKIDKPIEFPQAFLDEHQGVGCPLEFKAPVTTSAVVNARDGASLVLGPDGKLNIAVHQKKNPDGSPSQEIDYERVEKSENLMIANISKSLDTMKNPLIQLSNMKGYGLNEEDQKVRFIRKLVESYCIENGKVNLEKYVKLRNALTKETKTQSASLSYDELYSSKYEFLVRPQALLTKNIQPIKSVTDTQSFREKLKEQKAAVKSFKQQHDERSILERITGLSEPRKEEFALAAIRELKAAGDKYNEPEFKEQRKFLKEYLKITDETKFKTALDDFEKVQPTMK